MPPRLAPFSNLLTPFLRSSPHTPLTTIKSIKSILSTTPFSTSAPKTADASKRFKQDARVTLLRYHLLHPRTPRPLRLSRLRALRHWTIFRAWSLFRRKRREREEEFLQRQFQSMHSACEELRLLDSPSTSKEAGRLYRIAMEKKGVFGKGGVPIEYGRAQVDRPGKEAWNHGWTR